MILRILWFMGQIIGYHVSNSFFIGGTRGKGVSSAAELSESLLQPSIDAGRTIELPANNRKINSVISHEWLRLVQMLGDEFVQDWLMLYPLRSNTVMLYPVDLNEVPFLRKLKDALETYLQTETQPNESKLLSSLEEAFWVADRLDKATDDTEIKLGTLFLLFAEITQIEKDRPGVRAQNMEKIIKRKLALLRRTLKDESPLAYQISEQLIKLWERRK